MKTPTIIAANIDVPRKMVHYRGSVTMRSHSGQRTVKEEILFNGEKPKNCEGEGLQGLHVVLRSCKNVNCDCLRWKEDRYEMIGSPRRHAHPVSYTTISGMYYVMCNKPKNAAFFFDGSMLTENALYNENTRTLTVINPNLFVC